MDDRKLGLDEERKLFVEKLGIYYEDYGIPRIGGRILGLMLVSDKPLAAEQMANLLKVSRGSVSINVRLLVSNGLIERISVGGDRSDYYSVSESVWDHAIQIRIDGFNNLKRIVEQGVKAVGNDSSTPTQTKLHEMLLWVDTMITCHEQALLNWKQQMKV
jgi:DNA-binding transcriptional regulator GbsR (MarR family)